MDRPDEHPLDGVWVPLDPASPGLARALTAAADLGATGATLPLARLAPTVSPGPWPLPLRLDLDGPTLRATGPAVIERARALEADLVGLQVRKGDDRLLRDGLMAAERQDLEVVLCVSDPAEAPFAAALADGSDQVVGLSLASYDEDALNLLSSRDDLGLLSGAPEFASAYRRGAGGMEGFPATLSPAAGGWLLELCRTDVEVALDLERRLLRFLEGHLRPAVRRLTGPGEDAWPAQLALHGAVGGWLDRDPGRLGGALEPEGLRARLLEEIPELAHLLA
ncbi:MAG: hypothetical protein ISQ11_00800 [Planctomycetes bacterium]|nr:hypothetical protein [Planctomycetota bacterium]